MGGQYLVGYKKPPRDKQFKPGKSGNPSGRPKAIPSMAKSFEKAVRRMVTPTINGKPERMLTYDAIAIQHTSRAASGHVDSTKLVIQMLEPKEAYPGNQLPPILDFFRAKSAEHEAENSERSPLKENKDEPDEHD